MHRDVCVLDCESTTIPPFLYSWKRNSEFFNMRVVCKLFFYYVAVLGHMRIAFVTLKISYVHHRLDSNWCLTVVPQFSPNVEFVLNKVGQRLWVFYFFSSQSLTTSEIYTMPGVLAHYHNFILSFRTWQDSLKNLTYKMSVAWLVWTEPISALFSSLALNISFKASENFDLILPWTLQSSSFKKLLIKHFGSVWNLLGQSLTSCFLPAWNKLTNVEA